MALCMNFLPAERIRVFISSAQNNENGFAWTDVRRRIKECLSQCMYFNPFIIEDEASVTPSLQFFQRQVERADVIVLLVKGVVRVGTFTEYALARKLNKPLLVYFLQDTNPSKDVELLRKELEKADCCTYHPVTDFNNIENLIRTDLLNNVVRAFQDRYYSSTTEPISAINTTFPEEKQLSNSSIPTKTELDKFSSCYNFLFESLSMDYLKRDTPLSEFHELGCQLINLILTGRFCVDDEQINGFATGCEKIFGKTDWFQKRWAAIRAYFEGNIEEALSLEEEALSFAKSAEENTWIINNILIDCRNLENESNKMHGTFTINGKYQNELSGQEHIVFLPILDRYGVNVYERIAKDEFRVETATRNTEILGTSIGNSLVDWANYLFTAAVYGSYTHIQISRRVLASLFSKYSIITEDEGVAFYALKQYILFGSAKEYKLYLDSKWDTIYALVTSNADELWKLTDHVPVGDRNTMKQTVLGSIGLYLSDAAFAEAEKYIFEYANSVQRANSETYFDSILPNIIRLNQEKIVTSLTAILKNRSLFLGNKFSHIVLYMNLDEVSERVLKEFAIEIRDQLEFVVNNNGDPQMIAALVQRDRSIFGELEACPNNGLVGIQEKLYRVNMGSQNWHPIMQEEIESAKSQFMANSQNGIYACFAENPYGMISKILRKEDRNEEIEKIVLEEFVPHATEVLNSEAAIQTKEACTACLCDVISYFVKKEVELPKELIETLRTVDVQKGEVFLSSKSRRLFEIRVFMAKIIAGIEDVGKLLQLYVDFGTLEIKEKLVAIDCIEKYLFQRRSSLENLSELIVAIVLQCTSEKEPEIRRLACRSLSYILQSSYRDIAELAINKAVFDPADGVRFEILNDCKQNYISSDMSKQLIELLQNDANYSIREKANKLSL